MPWEDLRYLFGEIMYGGHITDDWDRRLCRTYLEEYMQPDMVSKSFYIVGVEQRQIYQNDLWINMSALYQLEQGTEPKQF